MYYTPCFLISCLYNLIIIITLFCFAFEFIICISIFIECYGVGCVLSLPIVLLYNLLTSLDDVIRPLVIQGPLIMREGGILIVFVLTSPFIQWPFSLASLLQIVNMLLNNLVLFIFVNATKIILILVLCNIISYGCANGMVRASQLKFKEFEPHQ